MAVDESLDALSTVAGSNTPAGTDTVGPDLDDHLRDIKKNIRKVSETSQGPTAPTGFVGRQRLATSATASNTLTWQMHDGAGYVSVMDIDTSNNNVSRFYAADGSIPGSAISGTASASFLGRFDGSASGTFAGFFDGSATGTFRGFFTGTASGVLKGDVRLDDGSSANPSLAFNTDTDTGALLSATGAAVFVAGGNTKWKYKASGQFFIGDNANAENLAGLTINQGAADDEIISLKSTDIAHGLTSVTETDTYAAFEKDIAADGGLLISAIVDGASATETINLTGYSRASNTAKSVSASAPVTVLGSQHDGADSLSNLDANGNVFAVRGRRGGLNVTIFLVDIEGDLHVDGSTSLTAFDDYDDVKILDGLRGSMMPKELAAKQGLSDWIKYSREALEGKGIVTYNDDGNHFLSLKGLHFLEIDAIRQMNKRLEKLERPGLFERLRRIGAGIVPIGLRQD